MGLTVSWNPIVYIMVQSHSIINPTTYLLIVGLTNRNFEKAFIKFGKNTKTCVNKLKKRANYKVIRLFTLA